MISLHRPFNRRDKGFTIIELVITIMVIGILAAFAMSRLLGANVFNSTVVRDQIITLARSTQQQALGRSDVALILRPNADELQLLTVEDFVDINSYTELQSAVVGMSTVSLSGDVNITDSCGVTPGTDLIGNSEPMVVQFDELGDLFRGGVTDNAGYPVVATTAMRICVDDDPRVSICFSPAGLAFAGDCE
ncbi:MAG: type II secretion system protein [Pseudomonadota bacterium]